MSEWIVQTAWGWRDGETSPELLVAWDFFSFEQNEDGFREEVTQKFAENAIRVETLRIVRLRIDGDAIRTLYEHAEVPATVEG